ncbi:DUF7144 family membrane protein [Demequina activiva]|uniref:DUF7144 domain-containing protein n=1 Tax=Demequina activiva TaxID=1582364 RepID=A0A919UIC6_9MICO|nr:hypothetical protein [Demequina activiva]GIG53261.1 hypothetical protein Dac01nite_00130 [Demequina activiva]
MAEDKQGIGNMPVGVAFVGVLSILNGIAAIVIGGLWLWASGDADVLGEVDTSADEATIYGWTALVLGVIIVLVSVGLLRGSRFARFLVLTLMVLRIGADVFALIMVDGYSVVQAVIGIAWALLIIVMLTTRKASSYFLQR